MGILYCGWNGFGQLADQLTDKQQIVDKLTVLPFTDSITGLSCGWSILAIASDKYLTLLGYLDSNHSAIKQVLLPESTIIKQLSTNLNHVLITSESGFCWSFNVDTSTLRPITNFVNIESEEAEGGTSEGNERDRVLKVCCSDFINLALSQSGKVWSIPSLVSTPATKVVDIACGNEHCILVTEQGSVYTWGSGSRGQLGHGLLEPEEVPREIERFCDEPVSSVSCGAWHCAVITRTGDLYTWGWDNAGQLGTRSTRTNSESNEPNFCDIKTNQSEDKASDVLENEEEDDTGTVQSYPLPVDTPNDVVSVSCGTRHTVVLLDDGGVWGCGWNAYGQLGAPPHEFSQSFELRRLHVPSACGKLTGVVCGGWSTCVLFT